MVEICNLRKQKPIEPYDVKVDRSSILGNPFVMRSEMERDSVCDKYELYFKSKIKNKSESFMIEICNLLKTYEEYGKLRLFCWCYPKRCHAETIKRYIENEVKWLYERIED